jgi:hypothetical protein
MTTIDALRVARVIAELRQRDGALLRFYRPAGGPAHRELTFGVVHRTMPDSARMDGAGT